MALYLRRAPRHIAEPLYVIDYKPEWATIFTKESARIKKRCQRKIIGIDHIGSTSIPGLAAKAIIDIAVLVKDWQLMPLICENLDEIGYMYKGDCGREGREYFTRIGFHVHLMRYDAPHYLRQLAFAECLRNSQETRDNYAELKRMLAKKWFEKPSEGLEYNKDKEGFILDVLDRAGWGDEMQARILKQVEQRLFIYK
ncbi:hypothetical protein GGI15_001817 [Coemansia interrupta]|uniref:GrpB family protein n=1 Tax=Coemansia interrupta TaxID=1126814 RepID=A0A9W8HIJ8_9FUNG|nr:hypothetical protein GGI15_001817 [Coemansia interrupta]